MRDSVDSAFSYAAKNDGRSLQRAIEAGVSPNALHPKSGTLLLQIACQFDALDCVRALLDMGADPSMRFTRVSRVDGRVFKDHVPLMYAENVETTKLLIEAGAEIEARDEKQWTPLVYAVNAGDVDRVRYLLGCGANPAILICFDQRMIPIRQMVEIRVDDLVTAVEQNGRSDLQPELERMRAIREILLENESRS